MPLSSLTLKAYTIHREHQRERILEAAERLFILSGIDQVSLSDIAQADLITRITVYEYFPMGLRKLHKPGFPNW